MPEEHDPRPFIASAEWRNARTVPKFPHSYLVQPREDAEDFFAFAVRRTDTHATFRSYGDV